MIDLNTLITPPTADQTLATFIAQLESLGVPASGWRKGGALSSILRVVATTYAGFANLMTAFIQAGFLDFATGDWLTLLAFYVYGVTRIAATFATGNTLLTNTGGGIYNEPVGAVVLKNSATGATYVNTVPVVLNPGDSLSFAFQAVAAGSASSSAIGAIDTLVTTLLGVICTNQLAFVGADQQVDDDLRAMCRAKLAALSVRGPRGAYGYAVTSATRLDGTPVNINRFSISTSSSTGQVTVYVAAPSGAPDPSDITAVATQIENVARPDTDTATVLAVTTVPMTRTITVYARQTDGIDAPGLTNLVNAALLALGASYPIGGIPTPPSPAGFLYAETVEAQAQGAHPSIYRVTGAEPDLALSPGQVATLAITVNVRLVVVP